MFCSAAERLNVFTLRNALLKTSAPVERKVLFPKFCLTFGRDSLIYTLPCGIIVNARKSDKI